MGFFVYWQNCKTWWFQYKYEERKHLCPFWTVFQSTEFFNYMHIKPSHTLYEFLTFGINVSKVRHCFKFQMITNSGRPMHRYLQRKKGHFQSPLGKKNPTLFLHKIPIFNVFKEKKKQSVFCALYQTSDSGLVATSEKECFFKMQCKGVIGNLFML